MEIDGIFTVDISAWLNNSHTNLIVRITRRAMSSPVHKALLQKTKKDKLKVDTF